MDFVGIKEFIKDGLKYVAVIVIVIVIFLYVMSLQQIVGPSMSSTLKNGDIVILDRISYRFTDIKRGDIISFYYDNTKYLIKRVIGLPGERVDIKDNVVYIDGYSINEKYLHDVTTNDFSLTELGYETIPDNMYFVLGDNREDSLDSRDSEVGLIERKDILGKVRIRVWPIRKN